VTAAVQHGSLPVYLTTMAAATIVAATPFVVELSGSHLVWWDTPMQAALAVAVVAAALAGAFVGSRLGAALTLGAVGTGVAALFVLHGAPDLALTQLLVETVIVVGFVLGLGHLRREFPTAQGGWKTLRIVVAVAGGLGVTAALAAASANPAGETPVEELTRRSVEEGGGKNVVNVVLTDFRALDTLGEVVVLATVAVGILALARTRTNTSETAPTPQETP
jgi:multicomponent Na+:H+ antiporter subunit A